MTCDVLTCIDSLPSMTVQLQFSMNHCVLETDPNGSIEDSLCGFCSLVAVINTNPSINMILPPGICQCSKMDLLYYRNVKSLMS